MTTSRIETMTFNDSPRLPGLDLPTDLQADFDEPEFKFNRDDMTDDIFESDSLFGDDDAVISEFVPASRFGSE